jgi:hypothetical protein
MGLPAGRGEPPRTTSQKSRNILLGHTLESSLNVVIRLLSQSASTSSPTFFLSPRASSIFAASSSMRATMRRRRERYFISQDICRADSCIICRALRRDLLTEKWCADEEIEKTAVKAGFIYYEQKIMAANYGTIKFGRHNTKSSYFCIDFSY